MDSQTKTAIKQLVLDLRHTLEAELAIALRRYGLETDRKWPLDAPPERRFDFQFISIRQTDIGKNIT